MDVPDLWTFADKVVDRLKQVPGVEGAAVGSVVPWRDAGKWQPFQFVVEGYTPATGEEAPYGRQRYISPGFFSLLGIPLVSGRDFTDEDQDHHEHVVIISQTIAQRLFPNGDALNRTLSLTGERYELRNNRNPARIVGIVADVDDERVARAPAMTLYYPFKQFATGPISRLFVRTSGDPHAVLPSVIKVIRELSPDGPVENANTLEEVRTEMLTPNRLNALVVAGFAGVALLIAVVGVAGVLAFSVRARTREFGVRLAVGSAPRQLLMRVLSEGASIAVVGIAAGAAVSYGLAAVSAKYVEGVRFPDALAVVAAGTVLAVAAIIASLMPAARAARLDVLQALRSE